MTIVSFATRSPGAGFWLITSPSATVELASSTTCVCSPCWWRISSAFFTGVNSTFCTATGAFLSIAVLTFWYTRYPPTAAIATATIPRIIGHGERRRPPSS